MRSEKTLGRYFRANAIMVGECTPDAETAREGVSAYRRLYLASMPLVTKRDLTSFAEQLLLASHASPEDARLVAAGLTWSDVRARHPQGVLRLPNFIQRLTRGLIHSPARMQWHAAGTAAAVLDADHAFGHVAGSAAMLRAVELAHTSGVGVAAVRHS